MVSWQMPSSPGAGRNRKLGKALYKLKTLRIFESRNISPQCFLILSLSAHACHEAEGIWGRPTGKTVNPKNPPWEGVRGRQTGKRGWLWAALPALPALLSLHAAERCQCGSLAIMKARSDAVGGGGKR